MGATKILLTVVAVLLFLWVFTLFSVFHLHDKTEEEQESVDVKALRTKIDRIERQVFDGRRQVDELERQLKRMEREEEVENERKQRRGWTQPIVVLVFVCNRVNAFKNHVGKLLKYRPSKERFPIVVTQDCDDQAVANAVAEFGDQISYIKHLSGEKANITVLPNHERYIAYYRISRHYRLALGHVFDKLAYTTAIITEDDLDVAADFFEYFSATRPLLERDKSLYCVSAWNDNGKPNLVDVKTGGSLLYRTDFFSGLGWMLTSELWNELKEIWPAGFWDDWIRDPARRKLRSCIRPELPRTAMTMEGKTGASMGLFFFNHLIRIQLAQTITNFTTLNLDYLLKDNYDSVFFKRVYATKGVTLTDLTQLIVNQRTQSEEVHIQYNNLEQYIQIADKLQIMHDFKAGVPRTAYRGIVTCYINGLRIYIVPDENAWRGYNPKWEAPPEKP